MRVLGIAGLKGSGKDTLAGYVSGAASMLSYDVVFVAFADALKRMLLPLGYPEDVLWGPTEKRDWVHPVLGVSARVLLQRVGTEGARSCDPDFWVKAWRDVVDKLDSGDYGYERTLGPLRRKVTVSSEKILVVTPDLRFSNEHAEMAARSDSYTVLIERAMSDNTDTHASERWCREAARQSVVEVIDNNGTLNDLRLRSEGLLGSVLK